MSPPWFRPAHEWAGVQWKTIVRAKLEEVYSSTIYFFSVVFQVPVSTTLPLYNVWNVPENVGPVLVPVIREEALWPLASKS